MALGNARKSRKFLFSIFPQERGSVQPGWFLSAKYSSSSFVSAGVPPVSSMPSKASSLDLLLFGSSSVSCRFSSIFGSFVLVLFILSSSSSLAVISLGARPLRSGRKRVWSPAHTQSVPVACTNKIK